eukprot:COSAG05_NODE_1492_length_4716_cov_20.157895_1_plen_321_part_10
MHRYSTEQATLSTTCFSMSDVKASFALIGYDDRFLVVQRRGKIEWQPPGGNLEDADNDNPEACLLREVAENVGLDLTADTFQIADESQYIDHCKANLYVVTTTFKPVVKLGNEIVEVLWVSERQALQNADFTLKHCFSTLGDEPNTQRQRVQYSYHYLCVLKNFDKPRVLLLLGNTDRGEDLRAIESDCPYQFAVENGNGDGVLHFTVAGPDQTPGVSLVASHQLDDYTIIRLVEFDRIDLVQYRATIVKGEVCVNASMAQARRNMTGLIIFFEPHAMKIRSAGSCLTLLIAIRSWSAMGCTVWAVAVSYHTSTSRRIQGF